MGNLVVKVNCEAEGIIETMDLLERHFDESPETRKCFDERFPSTSDMLDVVHAPRDGESICDLNVRIEPSEALKSFIQDLI